MAKRSKKKKERLTTKNKEWHAKKEQVVDTSIAGHSIAWQAFIAGVERKAGV